MRDCSRWGIRFPLSLGLALVAAGLALFARHGIARISLNAIAKEAGVTPAMLHYYFSSREALSRYLYSMFL